MSFFNIFLKYVAPLRGSQKEKHFDKNGISVFDFS